jgi:hypothetical protein
MPQPDDLNLYPREDSAACWIAVNDWRRDADPVFAFPSAFRWDLTLDDIPLEGEIVIAASSHYLLWINGRLISRGPARSKPSLRFLDHISLNGLLVEETNAIAIMVLPPTGVTGYSCPTRTGLLCSGKVVTATKTINFDSGPHWKVKEADWISSHGWVTSLPTGWQEHWNQAKESKTWHRAPCVDWENARLLGPAGTPPWKHLHRRPIPLLKHEPIIAKLIWEGLDDKSPGDPRIEFEALLSEKGNPRWKGNEG